MPAIQAVSSHAGLLFLMTERSVGLETNHVDRRSTTRRNLKICYCGPSHPFL